MWIKKFLAFIGLASVTLEDGKATVELTEEQMEASGKIITERDEAVANVGKLQAELEEERQQNTTAQSELAKANERIEALEAEKKDLEDKIEVLNDQPAEETTEVVTENNSVKKKGADPCVTKKDGDIVDNILKVKEEYL